MTRVVKHVALVLTLLAACAPCYDASEENNDSCHSSDDDSYSGEAFNVQGLAAAGDQFVAAIVYGDFRTEEGRTVHELVTLDGDGSLASITEVPTQWTYAPQLASDGAGSTVILGRDATFVRDSTVVATVPLPATAVAFSYGSYWFAVETQYDGGTPSNPGPALPRELRRFSPDGIELDRIAIPDDGRLIRSASFAVDPITGHIAAGWLAWNTHTEQQILLADRISGTTTGPVELARVHYAGEYHYWSSPLASRDGTLAVLYGVAGIVDESRGTRITLLFPDGTVTTKSLDLELMCDGFVGTETGYVARCHEHLVFFDATGSIRGNIGVSTYGYVATTSSGALAIENDASSSILIRQIDDISGAESRELFHGHSVKVSGCSTTSPASAFVVAIALVFPVALRRRSRRRSRRARGATREPRATVPPQP